MSRRKFGIIGTILVHVIVLFMVLYQPIKKAPEPPPPEMQVLLLGNGITQIEDQNIGAEGQPCSQTERTYVGVGFMYNWDGTIIDAPEHLPAYLAGIRVGDIMFDRNPLTSEEGVPVTFRVLRNNIMMIFKATPRQICYH